MHACMHALANGYDSKPLNMASERSLSDSLNRLVPYPGSLLCVYSQI